jgi:hypothetical protein
MGDLQLVSSFPAAASISVSENSERLWSQPTSCLRRLDGRNVELVSFLSSVVVKSMYIYILAPLRRGELHLRCTNCY